MERDEASDVFAVVLPRKALDSDVDDAGEGENTGEGLRIRKVCVRRRARVEMCAL